jgi:hypothetical protein
MPRDKQQAEIERLVRPLIHVLMPVLSREEVGELLGLGRSRVHQIECQALYKVYVALQAEHPRDVVSLESLPLPVDHRYFNLYPTLDDAAGEKSSGATDCNCDQVTDPSSPTGNATRDVARVVTPLTPTDLLHGVSD